ncbi:MAG TPA: hypothetical protein VGP47_09220 [Parachlamydiaceae bacterium]|nr:hypothetical protein [Parachlamydiaceae bacterium]
MTSATDSLSIKDKIDILMTPTIDPNSPLPLIFLSKQVKRLHGELQGRLCEYLSPNCAEFSLKLLYAFPISWFINSLSPPQSAVISLLSGAFMLSCKDEIISKESKVNLLHSIAIGFFANLLSVPADFSQDAALRLLTDSALIGLNILAANQIEGVKETVKIAVKETIKEVVEEIATTDCAIVTQTQLQDVQDRCPAE